MDVPEIAAAALMAARVSDPLECPTCGTRLALTLVGKSNPVYVAMCTNAVVRHPTWICTPTAYIPASDHR